MSVKRIENLGSFWTTAENGNKYEIFEFQDIIDAATFDDPHGELRGLRSLRTVDGRAVNSCGDNQFEIVDVKPIHVERGM